MPSKDGYWCAPRMWEGETAYILGGGPGLSAIDVDRLKGQNVIVINNSYKIALWAPVLFFCDCRWPDKHGHLLGQFGGIKVTTCDWYLKNRRLPGFLVLKRNMSPDGIAHDPHQLQWNKSSGACALGLAVHFGVKRIILCGFDMKKGEPDRRYPKGRSHWHDDYEADDRPNRDIYGRFAKPFPAMARDLEKLRVEVLNATPGSALDVFPMISPDDIYPQPKEEPCQAEPSQEPTPSFTN